jgi:hypothetical protein
MSNDQFNPHDFAGGAIVAAGGVAFSMMAGMQSVGVEIGDAIAHKIDADNIDAVNDTIALMRAENFALQEMVTSQTAAFKAIFDGYQELAALAVAQAEELQQLRAA